MVSKAVKIAVLSGKGGTGKTLVSVNLAAAAKESVYIDCDVEEPNGHLFLKPVISDEETVTVRIPAIDERLCNGCRKCVDFCAFGALAFVQGKPILFDEVCHACGGCELLCPVKAICEKEKAIGNILSGVSGNVTVYTGSLNIGETSGIPLIKRLLHKKACEESRPVFIDCPPGSSCAVMESIHDADYCILVAEPTVFGAYNLAMVYELVKLFGKPHSAVLNKCLDDENPSEAFCLQNRIPILGRIPFDSELGELGSEGKVAVREEDKFRTLFGSLLERVGKEVRHETAPDSQR
ncbi:MAG TPA: ATP-binding protein [Syntrophomonas sp.]|nr:ATP-binding protein [Syntrophomonas sp.]